VVAILPETGFDSISIAGMHGWDLINAGLAVAGLYLLKKLLFPSNEPVLLPKPKRKGE
jgi:hypothetical protein